MASPIALGTMRARVLMARNELPAAAAALEEAATRARKYGAPLLLLRAHEALMQLATQSAEVSLPTSAAPLRQTTAAPL